MHYLAVNLMFLTIFVLFRFFLEAYFFVTNSKYNVCKRLYVTWAWLFCDFTHFAEYHGILEIIVSISFGCHNFKNLWDMYMKSTSGHTYFSKLQFFSRNTCSKFYEHTSIFTQVICCTDKQTWTVNIPILCDA